MPTVKEIVSQLPEPDDRGLYSQIDKDVVDRVIAQLQQGGRKSLPALIDMIKEPGNHADYKAHYALHCWAVQVCKAKKEKDRRLFAETLASQIGGGRPKAVQKYLVQQLQVAGRREVVGTLGALLTDEELCEPAAQALTAIREGALEQYRKALVKAKGKCRLNIIQNLGVLQDDQTVNELRQALKDSDQEVRIAAGWALANIGDAGSVELICRAADTSKDWERIQQTKACLLLAERLAAAGKKGDAKKVYQHLRDSRKDSSESYVREAVFGALKAM
jgi:HEAT repeat protein